MSRELGVLLGGRRSLQSECPHSLPCGNGEDALFAPRGSESPAFHRYAQTIEDAALLVAGALALVFGLIGAGAACAAFLLLVRSGGM